MPDSAHLILVGRYPPPLGGNTIHLARLVGRLTTDRRQLTVVDVYNPGCGEFDQSNPHTLNFSRLTGWRATRHLHLLGRLRERVCDAIVHFHISAGANFYRYAALVGPLTRKARRRVLTIHSGGWVGGFEALSRRKQERALRVISSFDDVICVNEQQQAVLSRHVSTRLHLIPAYLPPPLTEPVPIPEPVHLLQQAVDVLIVTSGYGTPVYDYATVLRGIEIAQRRVSIRLGLVVATYTNWDQGYWAQILGQLRNSPVPAVTSTDLSPSQFLAVLAQAGLYVRATLTDGDAVAIREAASVGTRVLASDAVTRPQGTALFRKGDAEGLGQLLVEAFQEREFGRLPIDAFPDSYGEILKVYGGS